MAIIPGKWEVFTLDTGSVVVRSTDGDTEYMVAKVWGDDDGDKISTASLIAAAPELLRLVQRLREVFEQLSDGDWRHLDATYVDQLIESDGLHACTQAIAKAQGRE